MARTTLTGIPVSVGVAIGKAIFVNRNHRAQLPRQTVAPALVEPEKKRLADAFKLAEAELAEVRDTVPPELEEHKHLLEAHLMMLKDPKLLGGARKYIDELRLNAEWALEKALSDVEEAFAAIPDDYFRQRAQDIRQVTDRVLGHLMGKEDVRAIEGRAIILAYDLTPADTLEMEVGKVMAFATVQGGKTSHTGITARNLGLPAVIGMQNLEESVNDGDLVILDGINGQLLIDPDEAELAKYNELQAQFEEYRRKIRRRCQLPGETIDGYRVKVLANIELFEEVSSVIDNGGEGIGLYRTEYAYLNRKTLPTEEELYDKYADLVSIMSPRKVVIRTLDLGADKFIASFGELGEANPAMGLRAIRFCLKHPELFKTQLKAILRASVHGNVSVMFPMISGLKEIRRAKHWLREAMRELDAEGKPYNADMPVGIMIELPAAVMIAEILAREVDFFSIGTNDLIQYSLGIDRTNQHVSYLYQPLHPAVLRAIKYVVDSGHQAGIEVSLCGEVAADPFCIPILLGMQIDCISMSPQAIPGIKRIIRQARMDECKDLLRQVVSSRTVGKINHLVKETIFKRYPEELTFYSSLLDTDELPA